MEIRIRKNSGPRVERVMSNEFQVLGLRDCSPLFSSRAKAEAWLAKELAKTPLALQPKPRSCLRCGKGFASDGFHNRMCDRCRLTASQTDCAPFSFGAIHGRKRA